MYLGVDVSFTEKVFDASSDSESIEAATYHHSTLVNVVGEDVFLKSANENKQKMISRSCDKIPNKYKLYGTL